MKHPRLINFLLILTSVCLVLGVLELYMRATVHISAGYGTAMENDWMREHWTPINSLGYRDVEPYPEALTNVLVIGDSFMAGYGVENSNERLSGVLQTALGSDYGVNVAAQIAWETPREFQALQEYPIAPDIVVWSHFANDILWQLPNYPHVYPYDPVRELLAPSYLLSFSYALLTRPRGDTLVYEQYQDDAALARHEDLLGQVIAYCQSHAIRLIFVVWDVPTHNDTAPLITAFLDAQGVAYVDMATVLAGRPLRDVAASVLDGHPNAAIHAEAAQLVYDLITH